MCTSLHYSDTNNAIYVGRTMEFAGHVAWQLSYFPSGLKFTSDITGAGPGISYGNDLAFMGVTMELPHKGQAAHESLKLMHGVNEAGLNFGFNAFDSTQGPVIEPGKVPQALALMDVGSWALGQFRTVAEVEAALKEQLIYAPPIVVAKTKTTHFHGVFYDTTGASLVLELWKHKKGVYANPVGVMTNGPEFPWHVTNLNNFTNFTNVDCNTNTFGRMQVTQPDSGIATSVIPGANNSPNRFLKAVYYSQYALKESSPDESVCMLAHIMNNFDRPLDITVDPKSAGGSAAEGKGDSEFTVWTALTDLNRRKLFLRSYKEMNYQQFDLNDLAGVKTFKNVPFISLFQGLARNDSAVLSAHGAHQ